MIQVISTFKKQIIFKIVMMMLFGFLFLSQNIYAQEKLGNNQPSRWFIGGNLGMQFGTVTVLDISPHAGYKLTNRLSFGAGITYQYVKEGKGDYAYSSNVFGARAFSSYAIIPEVFAYAEYEVLNYEVPINTNDYARKNVSSVLVGGGYRQLIGPNMYSDIMILWNLTESPNSRYSNPIYRVGLIISL